jgi:PAS domain S-box-containing protein
MFANVIVNFVGMIVMFILWFQNHHKYAGLSYWVLDWVLLTGGTLLITLQGTLPPWESMILSNSMIVGGTLVLYFGLSRFAGKKNSPLLISSIWVIFAIFVAVHSYYTYIHNDLISRSYNANIGLLLACLLGIWLILRGVHPEIRRFTKGTGAAFAVIAAICVARILGLTIMPQISNQFLQSDRFDALMVMLLVGAIAFLVFNLVLMVNRRLYIETEEMKSKLNESVMELQAVFKNTSIGFGILVNRVFKEVNDPWCETTGYSREEIIGQGFNMFFPTDEEYQTIRQTYQKITQEGSTTTEIRLQRKNAEKINVIVNISALDKNDLSKGVIFSIFDITERKRLEEKANYLASFPELNPNPVMELDQDGNLKYQNPAAKNAFPDLGTLGVNHPFLTDWLQVAKELEKAGWSETIVREIKIENEWYEQAISPITKNQIRIYGRKITKRKQTEAALTQSEENYRNSMDSSFVGIYIVNSDWDTLYVNKALLDIFGYENIQQVRVKRPHQYYTPESYADFLQRVERLKNGQPNPDYFEIDIIREDGALRHLQVFRRQVFWDGKQRNEVLFNDITERKQAENALKESEENLRISLENAPDGVYLCDLNGIFLYGNIKAEEIIGYKKEELIGNNFFNLNILPVKYLSKIGELLKLNATGKPTGPDELELIRKDKSQVWVEISTATIKQKGNDIIIGFVRDISERKIAEEALRKSEEKYRLIVDNTRDIIFMLNVAGEFIYVSPSVKNALGYNQSDLIGHPFQSIMQEEDIPNVITAVGRNVRDGYTFPNGIEFRFRNTSGQSRWYNGVGNAVADVDGKFLTFLGVARDVTERKKAEEQIRASLLEKETLLKEVHHRVKNNMQVISSLLRLQEGTVKDKALAMLLRDSQNRIQSMALVYNKLYQSENLANINMNDYINELTAGLVKSYASNPDRIAVSTVSTGVYLTVDIAIPCGLVINELVTNSLKYAFPENKTGQISVSLKEDADNMLVLTVSDNGVGIPNGISLLNNSTLGLKLVGNLVQNQLGGKIELERSHGTTFKITFPRPKEEK